MLASRNISVFYRLCIIVLIELFTWILDKWRFRQNQQQFPRLLARKKVLLRKKNKTNRNNWNLFTRSANESAKGAQNNNKNFHFTSNNNNIFYGFSLFDFAAEFGGGSLGFTVEILWCLICEWSEWRSIRQTNARLCIQWMFSHCSVSSINFNKRAK